MKKLLLTISISIFSIINLYSQIDIWGISNNEDNNYGNIFKIADSKALEVIHNFENDVIPAENPNYSKLCEASNGKLYGLASGRNNGNLYEYNPITKKYKTIFRFDGENFGADPKGSVIQASNGKLYGMTAAGGLHHKGVIFEYDLETSTCTKLFDFNGINGSLPFGSLIQATNGKLYGMTAAGGYLDLGTLFSFDIDSKSFILLVEFNGALGNHPYGDLFQAKNGKLYGLNYNSILEFDITTNEIKKLLSLEGDASLPRGNFIQVNDNNLITVTDSGIMEYHIAENTYNMLYVSDNDNNGKSFYGSLLHSDNGLLYGTTYSGGKYNDGIIYSYNLDLNEFKVLISFQDDMNGSNPKGTLIQASNGNIYGTTSKGPSYDDGDGPYPGNGIIFEYNIENSILSRQIIFGTNSGYAKGALMLSSNDLIYGISSQGGIYRSGAIFELNPSNGNFVIKHSFKRIDGYGPVGELTEGKNGILYGMTAVAGSNNSGTLFSFNPYSDEFKVLYNFTEWSDVGPDGKLILHPNGKLYGINTDGGKNYKGYLFEFDPKTKEFVIKIMFDDYNHYNPSGALCLSSNGNLYGITEKGGTNNNGTIFKYNPINNEYTKLVDFDESHGEFANGGLVEISPNIFIGQRFGDWQDNNGIIYKYVENINEIEKIYSFDGLNGKNPTGKLTLTKDNKLIGQTTYGGENNKGVLFEYNLNSNIYSKISEFNSNNGNQPKYSSLLIIGDYSLLSEISPKNDIIIFPNPTSLYFKINIKTNKKIKGHIYNSKGVIEKTFDIDIDSNTIDVSDLKNGIYYINILEQTYKVLVK